MKKQRRPGGRPAARPGHRRQPDVRRHARAPRHIVGATLEAARGSGRARRSTPPTSAAGCTTRWPSRRAASASTTTSAIAIRWLLDDGRRAGRVRRHRRAPRRRCAGDLLRRPAGADDQPAREPADAVPRHRLPAESGGPGAEGTAVNVALPPGTGDAGWLRAFHAVVPAAAARLRAERPGDPARLRLPPGRSARPPDLSSTVSGRPTWRCTTWPTRSARDAGSPPAAAGTP